MHVSALLREEFLNESQVQWDNIEIKRKKNIHSLAAGVCKVDHTQ